jgi:hypothetical protein
MGMAQALVFYSAADSASVEGVVQKLGSHTGLGIRGPVPAAVTFGARVVVVWSAHAAAEYAPGASPKLPRNALVLQLDDTPLPAFLAQQLGKVRATGNATQDGETLTRLLNGETIVRRVPAANVARAIRPISGPGIRAVGPAPRTRAAASRAAVVGRPRRTHAASMVTAAGAMGTLAAIALGVVVPADQIITPSFAANTPPVPAVDPYVREGRLAQAQAMAGVAQFADVMTQAGLSVTFSAEEMARLTETLSNTQAEFDATRAWSDSAIARLQSLSTAEPSVMPSMNPVPSASLPSIGATASVSAAPIESANADGPAVLRERFQQVEPVVYAVDRMEDVMAVTPQLSFVSVQRPANGG